MPRGRPSHRVAVCGSFPFLWNLTRPLNVREVDAEEKVGTINLQTKQANALKGKFKDFLRRGLI